ncbi:unnamed protein product [Meganyctiphanes norvegica]|uniref:C-type lectin domain-containing protein n=1 Tax=Meganyctiphanes norvegica TaxID=48144 RepID=A0AAV2RNA3_MEGNR
MFPCKGRCRRADVPPTFVDDGALKKRRDIFCMPESNGKLSCMKLPETSCRQSSSLLCPEPFWPIMNECFYAFHHKKVTWQEARKYCKLMGGDLAQPKRPIALAFHLIDEFYSMPLALGGYKPSSGEWEWVSGHPINGDSWASSKPATTNGEFREACMHYWPEGDIPFVSDYDCNEPMGFVCQYMT